MSGGAVRRGFAGWVAGLFISSRLTPLAVLASLALGLVAVLQLPREEEPQIDVPMIDVFASMPGANPDEVEARVTRPMERLLWEVPGVEYVYSTSSAGEALVVVRFKVGTPIEPALVRVRQRLDANADRMPPGVAGPLVKPRTIDDVPVLALTFHGGGLPPLELRRVAAQVAEAVKAVPDVAETTLVGGARRELRVQLDPVALEARGLDGLAVLDAVRGANARVRAGSRAWAGEEVVIEAGNLLRTADEVGAVVVGGGVESPVRLRDVAVVVDGPAEPTEHVLHGARGIEGGVQAAVTLSVAKRPGTNAVEVVERVGRVVEALRGTVVPSSVAVTVTRDYGHTAEEKGNELLLHMGIAVFGVAVLILLFLGWRESLVVLLAIPSTLGLTLLVFLLYGYTLNRITLFALIFSIGILVDDAIVVVENIVRHRRLPGAERKGLVESALEAVEEVGNPTVLATWAVIAAILPMAFVGGLMGPYMRPIPIGSTAAMLFSLLIAFAVTPWAAVRLLGRSRGGGGGSPAAEGEGGADDWTTRVYRTVMGGLLTRGAWRWAFLAGVAGALALAAALVPLGAVKVKMLPFDNKSEFQLIVNAPEGTTLEATLAAAREMGQALLREPEVRDYQVYAGVAAPFNFNGLVRHYFLRRGPTVADVQVNLVGKGERSSQSHAIAVRVRPVVAEIARRHGVVVAVAEVPPGPPVLQTLVAEVYGPDEARRVELAAEVRRAMEAVPGVVDVDWYVEATQPRVRYVVDVEKAGRHGVPVAVVSEALALAAEGRVAGLLRRPEEREDVPLRVEFPPSARRGAEALLDAPIRTATGLVPLRELARAERGSAPPSRYRKNLQPVTYVTADVAGAIESPAYALLKIWERTARIDARSHGARDQRLDEHHLTMPTDPTQPAVKWDGEWHITLEVFRDLGLAFAAVLILIAMLMVGWFRSYVTPLVVMAAIPFSLIGILPAHWAMGAFFTATSMIGFMAGAGIVVRNSIILVDFIELRRALGRPLTEAVVEAGAVRFRPMLLTALAVVVGASVILADPIFQGLAISLMFGEIASLLVSRMAVPVLYFIANRGAAGREGGVEGASDAASASPGGG